MTINNIKLVAIGAAIYFAGMAALLATPAHAGVRIDPNTHYQTYVPDQWQPVPPQNLRPPTFPQPTIYPQPNYDFNLNPQFSPPVTCRFDGNAFYCG